jgi:Enoyl-(Acyl carrier protein) reductase
VVGTESTAISKAHRTKFAVHGFTRALSRELGSAGVTVNGVRPGPIDTELSPENGPKAEVMKKLTSVGRFGKVEEIAAAVTFLASPEAAFINGENQTVGRRLECLTSSVRHRFRGRLFHKRICLNLKDKPLDPTVLTILELDYCRASCPLQPKLLGVSRSHPESSRSRTIRSFHGTEAFS